MATRLIKADAGSGGEATYTLAGGESWRLVSVVAELRAQLIGSGLVPTLVVEAQDGSVIAEIANATAFV